ncbi:DUF6943 family protein [Flavobacterium aureirubrum]|uniref:DUF6943 family protein n=1 Tax=Flavobacterium aureirubrum TaxID=3133147 RepID=UPI0039B77FA0
MVSFKYDCSHLFVLKMGMNSGKPKKSSFHQQFCYHISKRNRLRKHIFCGIKLIANNILVPTFNRFCNYIFTPLRVQKTIQSASQFNDDGTRVAIKNVVALKLLEQKEKQFHENLYLISDLHRAILFSYCRK